MTASPARIEANLRNAQKSTGPSRSDSGTGRSRRNAIKHGLTGSGAALPEAMTARVHNFEMALRAEHRVGDGDDVGRFLVAQAALAMARLEAAPAVEWEARREQIDRAEHGWHLDRARDAATLGDRLARRPSVVLPQLLQTAQGCDWLIERLDLLAATIEAAGSVDDAHRRMLADLLGLPAELRDADPRVSPDRTADELAALAREERNAAIRLKAEVLDPRDEDDRQRTLAGLAFDRSPAARRLRGYESASNRRLRWATDQLRRRPAGALLLPAPSWLPSLPTAPDPEPAPRPQPAPPSADLPSSKTNPTSPTPPAPNPSRSDLPPLASPASDRPRPTADRVEKRTQPALAPRPMATADRPVLLNNRRSRRAAAARARHAG